MIDARIEGRVGRITLNRPEALNALTHQAIHDIDTALQSWANDPAVSMLIIDAAQGRAFCSGGDISEMYATGTAGDYSYGRQFWRDEYQMNARLFTFPKPVATFLHGFTMGGGVGVGCHGSHRIVGETSQIAMPECGIGLMPDVGGTLILSQAPGRLGEYLGVTGYRMGPGCALHTGFADYYILEATWPALIDTLTRTGDWDKIDAAAAAPPPSQLAGWQAQIDADFGGETLADIYRGLSDAPSEPIAQALKLMGRNSPLAMACTIEAIHRVRVRPTIDNALGLEYRFSHRAMERGDFLEGIRAAIVDKDRNPKWQHADWQAVRTTDMAGMLLPLGAEALKLKD